ncbi:UPF0547 protein C16orf87 homolog isoform X1 [Petromyzon marinus]|uniref:UPF0547 protein C16orf87 homolog isoform X1 n=1 Tax=Petromyzon marinus TaxID=7757 RepID=A0AAJ7U600_PETMA|nr:UPF0547 protein C16orf87 homolog isoform X1 [Petromyzon marinus]
MSANKSKKSTKTATKNCPRCEQQIPVACKSCTCGNIFISRKLLNLAQADKPRPTPAVHVETKPESKRRRPERARRDRYGSCSGKSSDARKVPSGSSSSSSSNGGGGGRGDSRKRGRPKGSPNKGKDEKAEKSEREYDIYAGLSEERAFVFAVALAEINRRILNQRVAL